eukprot:1150935-Pelagomonas_calceolata.AAC.13
MAAVVRMGGGDSGASQEHRVELALAALAAASGANNDGANNDHGPITGRDVVGSLGGAIQEHCMGLASAVFAAASGGHGLGEVAVPSVVMAQSLVVMPLGNWEGLHQSITWS